MFSITITTKRCTNVAKKYIFTLGLERPKIASFCILKKNLRLGNLWGQFSYLGTQKW